MKANESIYNKERQRTILTILKEKKRVTVKELIKRFETSGVTIRNDLNTLAQNDEVIRTHGGAIYVEEFRSGFPEKGEKTGKITTKTGLYAPLSSEISDGDVLFLDANLPTREIVNILKEKNEITVFTNNLALAYQLAESTDLHVIVLGGRVKNEKLTINTIAVDTVLEGCNISKAFFSAWGVSLEEGLTDNDPEEIRLKQIVARHSRNIVVVLDHTKFNKVSFSSFLPIDRIDTIITDDIPANTRSVLREKNIRIVQTEEGEESSRQQKEQHEPYTTYTYYRSHAVERKQYPGQPGKGKRIAFANGYSQPKFCQAVEKGIVEQAKLAGFAEDEIYVLDNQYDRKVAMENAEKVLEISPHIFIEFQVDFKVNNMIASKLREAGIPIIALEIPIPGAPYIGVDNWQSAIMAGDVAAQLMKERWNGWGERDLAVLFQMEEGGEATMLRSEGFAEALEGHFGEKVEEKILRIDIGKGRKEEVESALGDLFRHYPRTRRFVMTAITERAMRQVVAVLREMNRWNPDDYIIITHGCDDLARGSVRNGEFDASIAHFPEEYGTYVVPAACAMMEKKSIPPYIFVENVAITRENIDAYYPS